MGHEVKALNVSHATVSLPGLYCKEDYKELLRSHHYFSRMYNTPSSNLKSSYPSSVCNREDCLKSIVMSSNKAHLKQHFVIHDSNSMAPKWYSDNDLGRMKDVASVIQTVVPECLKSDADGIDINFVNSDVAMTNIQTPAKVGALINSVKPEGEWYPAYHFDVDHVEPRDT